MLVAGLIFFASGQPGGGQPFLFEGSDKLIHFFVFGLLATLVLRSRVVWSRGAGRGWIAVAVVSLYGISDEFHQSFTPGRSVEFADWIADTLGALVAVCAYLFWGGYRALIEKPLWDRRRNLPLKQESAP